jgi:hypothetical protein
MFKLIKYFYPLATKNVSNEKQRICMCCDGRFLFCDTTKLIPLGEATEVGINKPVKFQPTTNSLALFSFRILELVNKINIASTHFRRSLFRICIDLESSGCAISSKKHSSENWNELEFP